jgi:putative FmdB family regulatory protein
MPTYEYGCTACGQHIEVFQRISEEPLKVCGVCGGALRKVFHPAGIVFKGSGFYATDSRSKPKAKEPKAGSEAGAQSSKSSTSSDGASSSEGSPASSGTRSSGSGGSDSSGGSGGSDSKEKSASKDAS